MVKKLPEEHILTALGAAEVECRIDFLAKAV